MVGEPTTFTPGWFDAFGDVEDATPLLAEARALKTEQEIERMRLANDIAAAAMEHCKLVIEPGMTEAQIAAEWEGFVHGEGTGWEGQGRARARLLARLVGPRDQDVHRDDVRPVVEGEPTLFEIWVCADGYWCDHTKNLVVGELTPALSRARGGLMAVYDDAVDFAARARASPSSTGGSAPGSKRSASRASRRTRSATASAPAPTSRRTRTRPAAARSREGMVLAIEPGCYIEGGGGLRVEDNFLITTRAPRSSRRSRHRQRR